MKVLVRNFPRLLTVLAFLAALPPASWAGGDCPDTPFSMEPDQSCTLEYGFAPETPGVFGGSISITGDTEPAEVEVALSGEGAAPPENEIFDDRFE